MRVRATEASRGFSSLLTRVAGGEVIEVDRHGEIVAVLMPPRRATTTSGAAISELIRRLPRPDERFVHDVRALAEVTTSLSEPWPS
ncbi:MAG: hypothetical protein ACRD0Z_15190 [Acidimicrobiales bacterium]